MSRSGLLMAAAVLGAGCAPMAGGGTAAPDRGPLVYVANQDAGTVSVVDATTLEQRAVVSIADLVGSANPKPHHIAVEPDGSHWYVSLIGANRVLKLDRDNRVVGQAEFEVPGMLVLDPESHRLLVGRSMSAVNPPRRIGVIDRRDMSIEEVAVLHPRPHALAVRAGGDVAYSGSLAQNTLAVVQFDEEDVEMHGVPGPPGSPAQVHSVVQLAVSPDGRTLVGTGEMSGRLVVYDLTDPLAPRLRTQLPVGSRPWHPVFSPDGSEVWFANKGANAVTVVETASWSVVDVIVAESLAQPHGAAISPDGQYVFVSSNDLGNAVPGEGGTLTVIQRESRDIVAVIPTGPNTAGVGTNARP